MKEEYCFKFEDLEHGQNVSKNIPRSEYASYLFDE